MDLARLYGVTTSALNQAVERNVERFPADFAFELTAGEDEALRTQIVMSKTNEQIGAIRQVLQQMLERPPSTKRPIGFRRDE